MNDFDEPAAFEAREPRAAPLDLGQGLGVFEAKTHLSRLVQEVAEHGTTFTITHRGKPVAELRPIPVAQSPLVFGEAANPGYQMSDDFTAPLTDFGDSV